LIQGLSKKDRRGPDFRGEKRNPLEKGEDEPSFCEW